MKKYLIGFLFGIAVSISSVVYASDSIQAVLYQANLIINGQAKNPEASGYHMLNYEGHAYVPLRYVAEQMNTAVSYDDSTQTITLDNRFNIVAPNGGFVKAGNLKVTPEGDHSKIEAQVYFTGAAGAAEENVPVTGKLVFWNEQGLIMEKVPFAPTFSPGSQITNVQLTSQTDLSGYRAVTLTDIIPFTRELPYPPDLIMGTKDSGNKIRFGVKNSTGTKVGDYTVFRMYVSSTSQNVFGPVKAAISFYDEHNVKLGTATLQAELNGLDAQMVEVLGKGDLTSYKTITGEVLQLDARPNYTRKLSLDSRLLPTAAEGKLTNMEFGLGASRSDVVGKWGTPQRTGSRQTQFEAWSDYQIFFSGPNGTVGAIGVEGESVRYTVEQLKMVLGPPEYEGASLVVDGWELNYKAGDYMLYFVADKKDGTVQYLTFKKQ
jgi:hypothetical protein